MPPMVSNNEDAHCIADDAKQKMEGKAMKVDAAKIALANGERIGLLRRLQSEAPQLGVKIVR